MKQPSLKLACCRITTPVGERGSGFLIAPDLVMTCEHVLRSTPPGQTLSVFFGGQEWAGQCELRDHAADWALIRLAKPCAGVTPLPLVSTLEANRGEWEAYGFPRATDEVGLSLKGRVQDWDGEDSERRRAIVLLCPQLTGSDAHGFSGSPVVIEGRVVGMLRQIIPDPDRDTAQFNILYACPASVWSAAVAAKIVNGEEANDRAQSLGTTLTVGMPRSAAIATQSLLERYLGSRAQPTAFGGREESLAALHAWLQADAPPIQLLVAPTGLGKTALVCRFLEQLQASPDLAVAFVAISQRFGTNLAGEALPALLGRLSFLYRVQAPAELTTSVVKTWLWQHLRQPLPDGRRLLLVIDGLDEADGWALSRGMLPPELPRRHRVLLSARERRPDEAQRLRRELDLRPAQVTTMSLGGLSLPAVAAALQSLQPGLSTMATVGYGEALARQLYRLSDQGDPLLLELLFDELEATGGQERLMLGAVELAPGLGGLWDRMVTAAERGAFDADSPAWRLIGALVSAAAPIRREDLIELIGADTVGAFDRALAPVARWLRQTPNGFVFSHPRLREYLFEEKLAPKEQQDWDERLLVWCEQKLEDACLGRAADPQLEYVLQGFAAHLLRSEAAASRWHRILSADYRRCWGRRALGVVGLQRDVSKAIEHVHQRLRASASEEVELAQLRLLIRSHLWLASIGSQLASLPAPLITALIEGGRWTPAHALTHLRQRLATSDKPRHIPELRVEAVAVAILRRLPDDLLPEAVELAAQLRQMPGVSSLDPWRVLVPRIATVSPARALAYAEQLSQPRDRAEILFQLADAMPPTQATLQATLRAAAMVAFESLTGDSRFNATLNFMNRFDPSERAKYVHEALTYARTAPPDGQQLWRFRALQPFLSLEIQQDVYESIFCREPTPETEAALVISEQADQPPAVAARVLRLLLSGPHRAAVCNWLANSPQGDWGLLDRLLTPAEVREQETAMLQWASERWHSNWSPRPRQLLKNRSPAFQLSVLECVRQIEEPARREHFLLELRELLSTEERWQLFATAMPRRGGREARHWVAELITDLPLFNAAATEAVLDGMSDRAAAATGYIALLRQAAGCDRQRLLSKAEQAASKINDSEEFLECAADLLECDPTNGRFLELNDNIRSARFNYEYIRGLATVVFSMPERYSRMMQESLLCFIEQQSPVQLRREADFVREHVQWLPDLRDRVRLIIPFEDNSLYPIYQVLERVKQIGRHAATTERARELDDLLAICQRIDDGHARFMSSLPLCGSEAKLRQLFAEMQVMPRAEACFQALSTLELQVQLRGLHGLHAEVLQATLACAVQVLDHPNLLVLSYIVHRVPSEPRQAIVAGVVERLCQRLRSLAPALAAHPGANLHNAFYDLGIDARRVVEQLAKDMHHLATVLSPEQAEELWDLLPANWAECQQQLLPRLPTPRREHELARLLHQARETSGPEHGRLLAALVPALPVEQRAPAIHEALAATNQSGPDTRPVVLSLVAQHLLPEHLPLAVELASRTWPSSYNALHIFLRRLPGGIRAQAMRLLQVAAPSLPAANRDEIMRALGLFRVDEEAAVALIDWENTRQAPALSRLLARESRWDNRQFLDALTHLRDRALPGGVPQANQEAEYRLLVRRLSRAPGLRVQLVDWLLQTLEQHGQSRGKLLAAIDLVAPTIRAVAGEVGADAWVDELKDVGEDWP